MKNYQFTQDSFQVTFNGNNKLQSTASFFDPPSYQDQSQIKQRRQQRSPEELLEIKKVFSAKPRSPNYRQVIKYPDFLQLKKKNSLASVKNEIREEEMNDYFIKPKKTAPLKVRRPIQEQKDQMITMNSGSLILPQLSRVLSYQNEIKKLQRLPINTNQSQSNNSKTHINVRERDFNIKSNSFHTKNNKIIQLRSQENSPDPVQYSFNGFKLGGLQSKIFRKTQFVDISKNKTKENRNQKIISQRQVDVGYKFDETQYWSRSQQESNIELISVPEGHAQTGQVFNKTNGLENVTSSRSFLQRKQQMAILNKLFKKHLM